MPVRISFSRAARADLIQIENYLSANAGETVARRVVSRILTKVATLAEQPRVGAERPDLGDGRRIVIAHPYVALYEIMEHDTKIDLIVLRVIHGARDLPAVLASR